MCMYVCIYIYIYIDRFQFLNGGASAVSLFSARGLRTVPPREIYVYVYIYIAI